LDNWIEKNGWAGYDPYDVKGTGLYLWLQKKSGYSIAKGMLWFTCKMEKKYPILTRRFYGVRKSVNAKAMGLFIRAYINLYESTGEDSYKEKALECIDWLDKNISRGYSGKCWGYPFDWQSKIFISKYTPSAVVSCVVGDGYWAAYQVLGNRKYLDVCISICNFLINDLNVDVQSEFKVCFSYTPIDDYHVHNANLFVAEFLIRIGTEIENQEYIQLGKRAVNYSVGEQNPDGSIFYWGLVQEGVPKNHIDHYHSGFEIRALFNIFILTKDLKYRQSLEQYIEFYHKNLISNDHNPLRPKMNPQELWPINVHTCAEAILCNATLAGISPRSSEVLSKLCEWTIAKMQSPEGYFYYLRNRSENDNDVIKIPYIRWGQAWMLLSLSQALKTTHAELHSVN